MNHLLHIALRSAWNRRLTLGLTLVAIALSVTMLIGVERLRYEAHRGFSLSISGTLIESGGMSTKTGPRGRKMAPLARAR